jgi:nicotinate-nucleotide adenylyltransferase
LEEATARSYSIDTIEKLQSRIAAQDELFFIIGADAFSEIRTWRRWEDVARAVRFLVVSRPGHRYEVPTAVRMERLDGVSMEISSSTIRQELAQSGRPGDVPECVLDYIQERGLYRGCKIQQVCPPEPDV